ncbi:(2Fe-2S)-binding protein [Pseudalkalibacillus salsuginis]|uniref:(2Fe-2S)-binding protein n=1 Tax=Pseudalkalibacillus salsuginis TaxID=2910972 RepID=UPI00224872E5|nr:(2Fe-2S)-binding protein [Pseudalkalibacillus salsuginis]
MAVISDDDKIICRCEEVSLGTIKDIVHHFHCSSREVKLRTRAGMGYCGGRICRTIIEKVVQDINNEKVSNESQLSYRPPIRPVTFGQLGGSGNDDES